eukprot:1194440-Prorocentrum_minimum.AAC.5
MGGHGRSDGSVRVCNGSLPGQAQQGVCKGVCMQGLGSEDARRCSRNVDGRVVQAAPPYCHPPPSAGKTRVTRRGGSQ